MADFADVAALAVASLDLEVVRLVRGAIRAADIEAGKFGPGGTLTPEPVFLPRRHYTPEPEYLPRQKIHPTPAYLPRPVIHPAPRVDCEPPPCCPEIPPPCHKLPPAPWMKPVWENPIPPPAIIKVVQYKTDIPHKGSLLDVFI